MKKLQITDSDSKGGYHIVYVNSETGAAATSPDSKDGHQHDVIYDPPRPPIEPTEEVPESIDPMTGEIIPGQPATPGDPGKEVGEWIVRPGGEDMHTHVLEEYRVTPKKSTETDKEILEDCMQLWREALSITGECAEKGRESEDFYKGKQWKDAVKRNIEALDRAALTINEIGPAIDTLIGYQMEQRTDLKFLPQEGGDQRVADMLNVVSKKVLDACYFAREETKVFKDICVPGKGVFNLYVDFKEDIEGIIKVERFPWDDVQYGPHEKEDLSDCEYAVKSRMYSIAMLKMLFGKKANDIEASYKAYSGQYPDLGKKDLGVTGTNTDYRYAKKLDDQAYTVDGTFPLVDVQRKQFRLAEVQRKIYKEVTVVFNPDEGFFFTAYDWDAKDVELAAQLPGFQSLSQMKTRLRITKFCGNVILSDENPADLPVHDFYNLPVYGYWQNGEFWGKVEAVKDPQREINKRRSQVMDNMNRMGGDVYFVEDGTFKDHAELGKFQKNRSKPGSVFKVTDINRTPKREEAANLPAGVVQIMQLDQENLQRLMNVVVQQGGANESGTMFLEKKKGALTNNQFLFDNMSFAKQKLGKLLVGLIQRYYSPERMHRLLNAQYSKQKFELAGEDFSTYSKEEIIELLESADLLEYDVIVTESSFSASTRLGIAKVLFELISQGAAIPPELPLEFVDMPSDVRSRITQQLQAQSEQQAQMEATTSNTEIKKTLLAKGEYTVSPEEAQQMGLVPAGGSQTPLASGQQDPNNGVDATNQDDEWASRIASSLAG